MFTFLLNKKEDPFQMIPQYHKSSSMFVLKMDSLNYTSTKVMKALFKKYNSRDPGMNSAAVEFTLKKRKVAELSNNKERKKKAVAVGDQIRKNN